MSGYQQARYLFLDLETTGLDSETDEITEAAWIDPWKHESEYLVRHTKIPSDWVIQHTDYVERILKGHFKVAPEMIAHQIKNACAFYQGTTYLVGANPAFDDRFLRKCFAKANIREVPYHYHLIDVEALVMGKLGLAEPPKLSECRGLLGILGANDAPHTALADAREAKLIFEYLDKINGDGRLIAGLTHDSSDGNIF